MHSAAAVKSRSLLHSKSSKPGGIGLQNMKAVVERYEGVLDIQSDSCFTLSVMLSLPSASKKRPSAP